MHEDDEYTPDNLPIISIDSANVDTWGMGIEPEWLQRVQVSFPDTENGYASEAQEALPLGWVNSAAITLDRSEDSVTLSISVGDPRGCFTFTVRRTTDGRLVMHVPYPGESLAHRPLTRLHEGTYQVG